MSVISSQPSYAVLDAPRAQARRLIVVITEHDREQIDSSNLIWNWAVDTGSDVLLLGLLTHPGEEPRLRRHLVSLETAIRDSRVAVEIRVQAGGDWIGSIGAYWRSGDSLVCYEGEHANHRDQPLDQLLRSRFDVPVYVLPSANDSRESQPTFMPNAVSLSGSIGVVIGFFLLQVGIVQWLHDWVQTVVLAGSVMFEIGLVWAWDSLTA
jgi:hypothetical protein